MFLSCLRKPGAESVWPGRSPGCTRAVVEEQAEVVASDSFSIWKVDHRSVETNRRREHTNTERDNETQTARASASCRSPVAAELKGVTRGRTPLRQSDGQT